MINFIKSFFINIHEKASMDDIDGIRSALESNIDINSKDDGGNTPLHIASKKGNADMVVFLLENGADIEAKNASGNVPLHEAAISSNKDVAELLIKNGASTDIFINCILGDYDKIIEYIDDGGDVNVRDGNQNTLLIHAAGLYHMNIVELLIKNRCDISAKNSNGEDGLLKAISKFKYKFKVVELLIKSGSNVDSTMNNGNTPLHWACIFSHQKALELLLEHDADIDIKNDFGKLPIDYAKERSHKGIEFLLESTKMDKLKST